MSTFDLHKYMHGYKHTCILKRTPHILAQKISINIKEESAHSLPVVWDWSLVLITQNLSLVAKCGTAL